MSKDNSKFTVNFYEVLGVEPSASEKEIRKQYSKLVVKYHPDKTKDAFESSLFELIQKAYETIGNEKRREEYDFFLKNIEMSKNNDFIALKNNYNIYRDLEDTQPKNKDIAQIEFEKVFTDYDLKHGIDRSKLDEKITTEEIGNKLDDLLLQREQDEIEFSQNAIFNENESFDISKFNAAYDMYKNSNDKQMTKKSNVMAFNFDSGNSTNFGDLDIYDKTFQEGDYEGNHMFSSVNIGKSNRLDREKIKNLSSVEYTLNHNLKEENYDNELKRMLAERDAETTQFSQMQYTDFNAEDKTFQFSQEIGITENMLDWGDNGDDLLKACKKLIELEKSNN